MSEWKKVKLGDCCEITSSKRIFLSDYVPVGIPFYRSKEIAEMQKGESISDPLFISNDKYEEIKCKFGIPQKGDLLLTAIGATLGIPFVIKNNLPFYFKDGNLIWFKNFNDLLDSSFLYTWMCSSFGYQSMQNIAIGSAQKALTISALKDLSLIVPPIEIQHRIATILSRYDSLTENYQKQIKLLEEAAQRLYKEWFVDLHFPGHENTKIVDGVPEGWEYRKIGDIVIYYDKQRKPLSSMQRMSMEKIYPYYGAATLMDYVDNYLFDGIYLLLGEDGTVITPDKFPVLQYVWGKFWVNNHAHVLRGKEGISTEFLYSMFKEMPIADIVTGAAQPKISQGRLSEKKILMPSLKLIQKWSSIAKHFFDKLRVLSEQIRLLTEARDRLLPKLMSGEIDV